MAPLNYTVVLDLQDESGCTVRCVEIPGAISRGEAREDALATVKEAIEHVPAVQREEFQKKTSTLRREISKTEVAGVASASGQFRRRSGEAARTIRIRNKGSDFGS